MLNLCSSQEIENLRLWDFIQAFKQSTTFDPNQLKNFSLSGSSGFSNRKQIILELFRTRVCPGPSSETGAVIELNFYAEISQSSELSQKNRELLRKLEACSQAPLGRPPLAPLLRSGAPISPVK